MRRRAAVFFYFVGDLGGEGLGRSPRRGGRWWDMLDRSQGWLDLRKVAVEDRKHFLRAFRAGVRPGRTIAMHGPLGVCACLSRSFL